MPTCAYHPHATARVTDARGWWLCTPCADASGVVDHVAWDRPEHDPCQRGTTGCCIDHDTGHDTCETW